MTDNPFFSAMLGSFVGTMTALALFNEIVSNIKQSIYLRKREDKTK